jgi:hypothetical protein
MDIITLYNELTDLQIVAATQITKTELTGNPEYYPIVHALMGSINELRKQISNHLDKMGDDLEALEVFSKVK